MHYIEFLREVHRRLAPETYLEIGVRTGTSLAVSMCRSVGIDPSYRIEAELDGDVALFRTVSDEYFARSDPLAPTGGRPFDLAFIDGLHLFEFALRDFIHTERHSTAASVVIFDDVLPRSVDEAARVKHTWAWTGDVYPMLAVLERYRPELTVVPVGTTPTGLLLVLGLDPANRTLADHYDDIVGEFRRPDPQPVPPELLERRTVVPPHRVLDASFWPVLAKAGREVAPGELRGRLDVELAASLGRAFIGRQPRSGLHRPPASSALSRPRVQRPVRAR